MLEISFGDDSEKHGHSKDSFLSGKFGKYTPDKSRVEFEANIWAKHSGLSYNEKIGDLSDIY